jgi:Cdc6-like AAA superfamily ATPase
MAFHLVDPEVGFTSDVIRDPERFVGRSALIRDCMSALNSNLSLLAIYGRRGVGKSSLLRQVQQLAIGNFELARKAGIAHLIPKSPRRYYSVYYSCDSIIDGAEDLVRRLCNDTDPEDGLLRLVPEKGKQLIEFTRGADYSGGIDIKVASWGTKAQSAEKYASSVPNDPIQTFRNFTSSIVDNNNKTFSKRESALILLDEFDVIQNKGGLGSLIKSLSSPTVKFGICGIGSDISALVADHKSVGRLVEQGAIYVPPMSPEEIAQIFSKAEQLFRNRVKFHETVVQEIASFSDGYPYLAQLMGKACVALANEQGTNDIVPDILQEVLAKIRSGQAFPSLEHQYQMAIGNSPDRALILTLLAEQKRETTQYDAVAGAVALKASRPTAQDLGIDYIDQLLPRLIDEKFGPVLVKVPDGRGLYEFSDPVFRTYVKLRFIGH